MGRLINIISWLWFSDPWWLLLLPLMALVAGVKRFSGRRTRNGVLFPGVRRLRLEGFGVNPILGNVPSILRWTALALGVIALAGPHAPVPPTALTSKGIDIMLALDVSESMRQRDFDGKSRFDAARDAAREFIDSRPADRIGLILFSGGSFSACPLTLDHDLLDRLVDSTAPGVIQEQGTAVGMALLTATNRLKASESGEKVVVLLTDGENNAGEVGPGTAAKLAAEQGIRIYTVFAGKLAGGVPADSLAAVAAFRQGRAELSEVAGVSGGRMFTAGDPVGLNRTFRDIDRLEKSRLQDHKKGHTTELYPWLLMVAGLTLVLELALSSTRLMRIP